MKQGLTRVGAVFLLLCFLLALPVSVRAEKNLPQDWKDKMDSFLDEHAEETASVSLAVFSDREVLYEQQLGMMNVEDGIRADEDSVYEWGSVSKMLVWVSVMQLVEEGKLSLDEELKDRLPTEVVRKCNPQEPLTMLHLMNHNAGFLEMTFHSETQDPAQIRGLEETILTYAPSQTRPAGEVVAYSNWGASLAALLVEKIEGKAFAEVVREKIFQPLQMERTAILPDASDNAFVAEKRHLMRAYYYEDEEKIDLGEARYLIPFYPAGAVCGTFADYLRFARALLPANGKSPLFREAETLQTLFTPSLFYTGTAIPRNCHGLWTLAYGNGLIGHSGNTGGFSAGIYYDPVARLGYAVMTNEVGEMDYNYGILDTVFGPWQYDLAADSVIKQHVKDKQADLGGAFLSARHHLEHGIAKLTPYVAGFSIHRERSKQGEYDLAMAPGIQVKQLLGPVYIMQMENGLRFLKVLHEGEQGAVLEGYTSDEIQVSILNFGAHLLLFLLFFVALLISLFRLLWLPLSRLHARYRKQELQPEVRARQRRVALASLTILILGGLVYTLVFSDTIYSLNARKLQSAAALLILLIQALLFARALKKDQGYNKIVLFQLATSILNCVYWEWFRFWFS